MKERTRFDAVIDEVTGRDVKVEKSPEKPDVPSMVMVVAPMSQATFSGFDQRIQVAVFNAGDRPLRFAVTVQWIEP